MKIRYYASSSHLVPKHECSKLLLKFTNDMRNGIGIIAVQCETTC